MASEDWPEQLITYSRFKSGVPRENSTPPYKEKKKEEDYIFKMTHFEVRAYVRIYKTHHSINLYDVRRLCSSIHMQLI